MSTSKPLLVNCVIKSIEEFGLHLFGNLYCEASAYAIMNGPDRITELKLFDVSFAQHVLERKWPTGSRIVMYSNHPEGCLNPSFHDLVNMEMIPEGMLCIVCEDTCVTAL